LTKVKLLEVFEEVKPTYVARSRGARPTDHYMREYEIIRSEPPEPLTTNKLREYVSSLQKRFPERQFYIKETRVDEENYLVLSQKSKVVPELTRLFNETVNEIQSIKTEIERIDRLFILLRIFLFFKKRRLKKRLSSLESELGRLRAELEKRPEKERVKGVVPLYFMLQNGEPNGKVFIPRSYWEKQRKLCTYIIHKTLGSLGLARTVHRRYIKRL